MTKRKPIKIGNCTYGWRMENGEWIEHEGEQRIISRIEKLRAEGISIKVIKDFLETKGIKRKEKKND